ncbi:tyrosine-type recombinase/integrase [Blastomonas fulva]|jgi:integrase|uniref:tyrosine-type recombinase/integrase n=1 Tax=Blastomonas fulva TaxID=1550728 RepID=UPI003D2A632A
MGSKITLRTVEAAKPSSSDFFIWDTEVHGFGLKVTKAGKKVYVLQFRMGGRGTPTRRHTIGTHASPWQPGDARNEARRLLEQVKSGVDPRKVEQERQRQEVDLRFDRYVQSFLESYAKREWGERTYKTHESNIRRWLVPVLGMRPLASIERRHITETLDKVPIHSPALRRDLFKLIRRILNWAIEQGDLNQSPMVGMRGPSKIAPRNRLLTDQELQVILAHTHEEPEWAIWGPFIRLLLITGQRRGEVAGMRWEELDHNEKVWTLESKRTKNQHVHQVPLNDLAIIELDILGQGAAWPRRGAVFQHKPETSLAGFSKMKARLDRIIGEADLELKREWRLHDIRRSFATGLQRLHVRMEVIAALQNHRSIHSGKTTEPYHLHDWAPERVEAMQLWADHLKALVAPQEPLELDATSAAGK